MNDLSPKERISRVLEKKSVDRPPVICPGGMMNAAIVEVMTKTGHTLPEGHLRGDLMADLASYVHQNTGFENLGVPFCMTVEAEVLGSEIDFGTLACEPKIAKEVFPSVSQVQYRDIPQMIKAGRVEVLADAVSRLARQHPDVPVIGSITGPVSTAASIVDPIPFLKELRKDPANTHQVMDYVSRFLIEYSKVLVESGASLICIGDPTATGEILGPKMFEEYAVKYINQVVDGIHELGVPVVVHICGNMKRVKELIPAIRSQAISTDALVSLRQLKEEYPHLTTMGNLSTFLLESGTPDNVSRQTSRLVRDGINIIAPACGLSTASSLENINAMTGTVQARA